jgi:AraC family transcriptional regulator
MNSDSTQYYRSKIEECKKYVQKNLFREITLEELAYETCFSPYHFHRLFTIYSGESIATYIRRLRLEYAASRLALTDQSISELTEKTLFQSPSAFAKSFKKHFGINPTQYRAGKRGKLLDVITDEHLADSHPVESISSETMYLEKIKVLSYIQYGPCLDAGFIAWEKLESFAHKNNLLSASTRRFGTILDSRDITVDKKHRYVAMISVNSEYLAEGEYFTQHIGDGTYAGFMHKGAYDTLYKTYLSIFLKWLPESGEFLCNKPILDEYVVRDLQRPYEELRTRIYIPVC